MADGAEGAVSSAGESAQSATPAAEVEELKGVKSKAAREYYMKNIAAKQTEPEPAEPKEAEPAETPAAPPTEAGQEKRKTFDEILQDEEYKGEFDKRMQTAIQKRLKNHKELQEKDAKLKPLVDLIAKKYGVDPDADLDGLIQKVTDDDAYYEDEALQRGIPVDALKQIQRVESENKMLKQAEAEHQAEQEEMERRRAFDQQFAQLRAEAEQIKQMYPAFDFDTEMQNPTFLRLAFTPGVGARTAYEIVHKDEIMGGAMKYAARQAQQQAAASIASGGKRPVEGWTGSNSPANTKIDVSALTSAQRKEYIKRAARGEKITFLD